MGQRRSPGALESAVLRALWAAGAPLTAQEIRTRIADDSPTMPALTTVLTVLDRLRIKQLVTKTAAAGGHVFAAASSESGFTADAMVAALLAAADRDAALLRFARRLEGRDLQVLRRALDGAPDSRDGGGSDGDTGGLGDGPDNGPDDDPVDPR